MRRGRRRTGPPRPAGAGADLEDGALLVGGVLGQQEEPHLPLQPRATAPLGRAAPRRPAHASRRRWRGRRSAPRDRATRAARRGRPRWPRPPARGPRIPSRAGRTRSAGPRPATFGARRGGPGSARAWIEAGRHHPVGRSGGKPGGELVRRSSSSAPLPRSRNRTTPRELVVAERHGEARADPVRALHPLPGLALERESRPRRRRAAAPGRAQPPRLRPRGRSGRSRDRSVGGGRFRQQHRQPLDPGAQPTPGTSGPPISRISPS